MGMATLASSPGEADTFTVSATDWRLPSTSTRIKSCAAAAADFQHPLKGVRGGGEKGATLCLGEKLAGRVFK